ncbi:hypothetical protein C7S14_0386 [Burkholderia cepacia]|nr:hypothetical protein C7S14_0386 [Burkholderia cepacia]
MTRAAGYPAASFAFGRRGRRACTARRPRRLLSSVRSQAPARN